MHDISDRESAICSEIPLVSNNSFIWSCLSNTSITSPVFNYNECVFGKYSDLRGCKIAHLNCRSLIKHLDQIRILLSTNFIHILSLNETRLDSTMMRYQFRDTAFSEMIETVMVAVSPSLFMNPYITVS